LLQQLSKSFDLLNTKLKKALDDNAQQWPSKKIKTTAIPPQRN
jgi:hypothetical protein